MDDPLALQNEILQSEAYQIYLRIRAFVTIFRIFEGNHHDLKQLLNKLKIPEVFFELSSIQRREDMEIVLLDVTRRFVNFLASAEMLLEHTDWMTGKWYKADSFKSFYEEYVRRFQSTFVTDDFRHFMKGFRDLSLHFELPLVFTRTHAHRSSTQEPFEVEWAIYVDKEHLRNIDRTRHHWSSKGKRFLESADDEIVIEVLIDRYFQSILEFYSWLHSRLEIIHAEELEWFRAMNSKLREYLEPLTHDDSE